MPRRALSTRILTTSTLVILMLLGSGSPKLMHAQRVPAKTASTGAMQVSVAWKVRAANLVHLDLTPNGRFACVVTGTGRVSVYNSVGKLFYSATVPGANRALLSPDGKHAMAYAHLDPTHSELIFLDSQGKELWKTSAGGAVWCADACAMGQGTRFVVGTGKSCIYVYDLSDTGRRYKWWRADGAVVSVNLFPNGESVLYGTWQSSMICRADIAGKTLWRRDMDSTHLHYLHMLNVSDRLILRSVPNKRGADGVFHVTDGKGATLWQGEISATTRTKVISSPDGRYVCLGSVKTIEHKGKSVSEKHAVMYDENGRRLWEQGSMFFHVQPLHVSSEGEALLVDSKGALFVVQRDGALKAGEKLPGSVLRSMQSRDGSAVLLECSDGSICKLDISQ